MAHFKDKPARSNARPDLPRKRKPASSLGPEAQKKQRQSLLGDALGSSGIDRDNTETPSSEKDVLLKEIIELGGDEDDFDLCANVSSDSEADYGDTPALSKGLQEQLLQLTNQLGFEKERAKSGNKKTEADTSPTKESQVEVNEPKQASSKSKSSSKLVFQPRSDWHSAGLTESSLPSDFQETKSSSLVGAISGLKDYAQSILLRDAGNYLASTHASSSHRFLSTIMTSGTVADKVSALTLAIQESPVHNAKALESLVNLASKRSRSQAIVALGALVDLLGPGLLLPSDRHLRFFHRQPHLLAALSKQPISRWNTGDPVPTDLTDAHLMCYVYEDFLKTQYFRVIQLLESWLSDEIEYSRSRALDFVAVLLKEKPEQESNLLRLLVNKLGDKERKLASKASYHLLQLQVTHPGIKHIIINTIENEMLLRPGQTARTNYYAVNTLNQTILSNKEPQIGESLLRIYFAMFSNHLKITGKISPDTTSKQEKASKSDKGDSRSSTTDDSSQGDAWEKLVSGILVGINRAVPFANTDNSVMESHLDTLFRVAHSSNFNTSIQALMLIQQLSAAKGIMVDRFYRTLYESLLDRRLVSSSKQAMYLNLLLRSLKNDVDVRRVKAFVKRILQVVVLHQPPFICGAMYVVIQLRQTFPDIGTLLNEPEEHSFVPAGNARLEATSDPLATVIEDRSTLYDGRKRDPEHSNAHHSCLWEIAPSLSSFHPSVSFYASAVFDPRMLAQKPDMESHSLVRFLDKFVYRNAKKSEATKGGSIMQPIHAQESSDGIWLQQRRTAQPSSVMNSPAFWNRKVEDIPADDVFFYEYFNQVGKKQQKQTQETRDEEDGEEEDTIWRALTSGPSNIDEGDESSLDFDLEEFENSGDDSDDSKPAADTSDVPDDASELSFSDMSTESGDDDEEGPLPMPSDKPDGSNTENETEPDRRRRNRKYLKGLPTFATADEYSHLLENEEPEFEG